MVKFSGRNQVLVGVVPKETPFLSNQSSKSMCPLAIANCKEDRSVFFFCLAWILTLTIINTQILSRHSASSIWNLQILMCSSIVVFPLIDHDYAHCCQQEKSIYKLKQFHHNFHVWLSTWLYPQVTKRVLHAKFSL